MEARRPSEVVVPQVQRQDKSRVKPIQVSDALPYTPLTTSVLPTYDRIPIPRLGRSKDLRLTTSTERKTIQGQKTNSRNVKEKLSALLRPDLLAEIKFKKSPQQGSRKGYETNLSPTAKMVLDFAKIDYRYPSPETPSHTSQTTNHSVKEQKVHQPLTPVEPRSPKYQNYDGPVAGIPLQKSKSPQKQYITAIGSPKRRKLNDISENNEAALRLRTQKEAADGILLQFQNQLLELFEAQDSLEADTSDTLVTQENAFFDRPDDEDESEARLSTNSFARLQSKLKQLVDYGRLNDISSDHIRRLQQLCERPIEAAQTINIQPPQDQSEDDWTIWKRHLKKAENGAAAASTFIYTVLGSLHDDNLVPLEVVRWLPNVAINLLENCLIPIIESRPDAQAAEIFDLASTYREELKKILDTCRRLLDLISTACVSIQGAEGLVNSSEFLAVKLIFVQNAHVEKQSVLGIQNYERVRKQAMSTVAKIYAAFPSERSAILDEVLTSIDKLPSTSRSARQYRLGDGRNIQLISALFMQLVQTASMESSKDEAKRRNLALKRKMLEQSDSETEMVQHAMEVDGVLEDETNLTDLERLRRKSDQLFDNAAKSSQEIISYLVGKASKVSKSGDSPYRNILDLFIEDLIIVLPMPEWPASELLLRILAARTTDIVRNEKSALTKNMALESLGTMGSAISTLRASVRDLASNLPMDGQGPSITASCLVRLTDDQMMAGLRNEDLISKDGPFAISIQHFRSISDKSLRAKSARSYYLAQYAKYVCLATQDHNEDEKESSLDPDTAQLIKNLLHEITTDENIVETKSSNPITNSEFQLAYLLSVLNLGFCRRFSSIIKTLASSFSSDQAQVRSRSLKSVVTMLETDPTLLDRDPTIADDVFKCASDESAMVRDSALGLIAKFIIPKPALEEKGIRRLLECAADSKIGVQKRALGHLKEIYNQDSRPGLKAAIAQTFLRRIGDPEESVVELAKRILSEVWISPSLALLSDATDSARASVGFETLTSHLVDTVKPDPGELMPFLKSFLVEVLKNSREASQLQAFCTKIVGVLFQWIIAGTATQTSLMTLVVFAEAQPQAVAPQQLSTLRRYLSNIASEEDLFMFKSVIGVFRCVLPQLSSTHNVLLKDIQDDLMKSINKLARRIEMDEVMSCLRTIDERLHNTVRLVKLTASVMNQIANPKLNPNLRVKLLRIAGSIGRHIDLELQAKSFQTEIAAFKGNSVAAYMADTIYPFTKPDQQILVRNIALESLGSVCQAWPGLFNKKPIQEAFFAVLGTKSDDASDRADLLKIQLSVLRMFDELYATRAQAKDEAGNPAEAAKTQDLTKMGGNSKTRDGDSAISIITSTVLDHVLRIALSEQGEKAHLAAKTLASISHQGMIHPKQSTSAFVALETSLDPRVADVAVSAHKSLHQQHESVCEREYFNAVQEAFQYQKNVVGDSSGAIPAGFKPKLSACFNIINTSGSKYVKKFLSNLISRLNVEPQKLDVRQVVPDHVLFVRFVIQNLAFFQYTKMEDLLHTILQLELAFSKNGAEVAQAIEAALQLGGESHRLVDTAPDGSMPYDTSPQVLLDPVLLKRLASAACAITFISEARSYLRRQYGVSKDVKLVMQQNKQSKDTSRTPLKIYGITGDRFWNNTSEILSSLESSDAMIARCKDFVALMAIDDEVRVAEGDEFRDTHSLSAEPDGQLPRGKKRKSNAGSANTTPKKQRSLPPKHLSGRRSSSISSKDDPDAEYEV